MSTQRALRVAVLGTTAVLAADVVARLLLRYADWTGSRWFDVGREHNIPTAWSAVLFVAIAALAVVAVRRRLAPGRLGWVCCGLVATYLAADEWFGWHERLKGVGRAWSQAGVALPTYSWVLPGLLLAAAGAVAVVTWSLRLPRSVRVRLWVALGVYGAGVLGVEALSGGTTLDAGWLGFTLMTLVEEGAEMAGALLCLRALRPVVLGTGRAPGGVAMVPAPRRAATEVPWSIAPSP